MSIKNNYFVQEIPASETYPWLLHKHYAKRLPMAIEHSYGLYNENKVLQGVCVFGPASPTVPVTIFGELGKHKVRELTRLVINDDRDKNTGSFFISQCFVKLSKPMCLVSFADSGRNHHGYIYQATNWIYTGEGGNRHLYIDKNGNEFHSLTIYDKMIVSKYNNIKEYMKNNDIKEIEAPPKHRYLYFLGNRKERKNMLNDIKLSILSYPKGDNKRYDTSYEPNTQGILF